MSIQRRPKVLTTKEKILSSGEDLFSTYWYETVSIANICRNANLSNGIFYKYFRKKEELFRELLEKVLIIVKENLENINGSTVSAKLSSFIDIIIETGRANRNLITIFREGQYRFPEFEKRLEELYSNAINSIYGYPVSEAHYLFVMAGIRFLSIRSLYNNFPVNKISLKKIIEKGIFKTSLSNPEAVFHKLKIQVATEASGDSKDRLLDAALKLFGERGFYNVNVYEIAKQAGLSVGAFYLYFQSKKACLEELVILIGKRTRHFISSRLSKNMNRLEKEIAGFYLFLHYFGRDTNYYGIVREAEFVSHLVAKNYYDRFEDGYLDNLKELRIRDKVTVANVLMGIAHYLGIETFFSDKIKKQKKLLLELAGYLHSGISS